MSQENKLIVARWFKEFWGNPWNPAVISDLAAPRIFMHYPLHEPKLGRVAVSEFMSDFRSAFPDLFFWPNDDLIAEGDRVVVRWKGRGTHTGPAFCDFRMGSLVAASGRAMRFSGTTVFRIENQLIAEELGQQDALTAMQQLGILREPEVDAAPVRVSAGMSLEGFGSNFGARPVNSTLPHGWNRLPSREGKL
jgi:predicted ester cyclase